MRFETLIRGSPNFHRPVGVWRSEFNATGFCGERPGGLRIEFKIIRSNIRQMYSLIHAVSRLRRVKAKLKYGSRPEQMIRIDIQQGPITGIGMNHIA